MYVLANKLDNRVFYEHMALRSIWISWCKATKIIAIQRQETNVRRQMITMKGWMLVIEIDAPIYLSAFDSPKMCDI